MSTKERRAFRRSRVIPTKLFSISLFYGYTSNDRRNPLMFHSRRPTIATKPTNWLATALEASVLLLIAGLLLLHFNPFWHLDQGGYLDFRVHWWNGTGQALTWAALVIGFVALVISVAAIVSRRFYLRPKWPYA